MPSRKHVFVVAVVIGCAHCLLPAEAAVEYRITNLGTLGGPLSSGNAINNQGQITGGSIPTGSSSDHAFLYDGVLHDLGVLGENYSEGFGVNDHGHVAGVSSTANGGLHAFYYDGTMHDLGTLGGFNSSARSVNLNGTVVGYSDLSDGPAAHAFLYDGTMHDLGTLGGAFSDALGINDGGQVTGSAYTADSVAHAYLYDGTMHDLGTLGGLYSFGIGISANGDVTGSSYIALNSTVAHAFLYHDGSMHDLGTLGGSESLGWSVNSKRQVAGRSLANDGELHAFIYSPSRGMIDLNSLIEPTSGWLLTEARAINENGRITGQGIIGGQYRGFLLTPVPEPHAIVALAAVAMVGCRTMGERRRRVGRRGG